MRTAFVEATTAVVQRHRRGLLTALIALPAAILVLDELTPPTPHLDPLMVSAPALTAVFFGPGYVGLVTTVTLGCMIIAGAANLQLSASNFPVQLATVVLISGIAAGAAAVRERREKQLAQARWVATVTQRVLLRPLPRRMGSLLISSVYLSADEEAEVGGDLYAVAELDNTTRILIGDAQGKGLATIEEVGYVLNAFRRSALHRTPLGTTADRLERSLAEDIAAAAATPGGESEEDRRGPLASGFSEGFITAIVADMPEDSPLIHLVNCGHPPPLLLGRGRVEPLLPAEPSLPLGLGDLGQGTRHTDTAVFGPGDTLLLYTDGLVEARDAAGVFYPLAERISAEGWTDQGPEQLLAAIRSDLVRHVRGRLTDDVALIAVQRAPTAPTG